MAKLNHKLKAGTLIESLIAMVIIVVCLGVFAMIYSNVLDSDQQRLHLKITLLFNKEAIEIKKEKAFLDSEMLINDWVIQKVIEPYPGTENLYQLTLIAINKKGKVIAERKELIHTE